MLYNKHGFSLIEVVVAAGIVGFLSLAVATSLINMQKSLAYADDKLAAQDLVRDVTMTVATQQTCQDAQIKVGTNQVVDPTLLGQAKPGIPVTLIVGSVNIGSNVVGLKPYNNLDVNSFVFNSNSSTPVTLPSGDLVYKGGFQIAISTERDVSGPKDFKPQSVAAYLITDSANKIKTCTSENPITDDTTLSNVCASLGGTFDLTTKLCTAPGFDDTMLPTICTALGGSFNSATKQCSGMAGLSGLMRGK